MAQRTDAPGSRRQSAERREAASDVRSPVQISLGKLSEVDLEVLPPEDVDIPEGDDTDGDEDDDVMDNDIAPMQRAAKKAQPAMDDDIEELPESALEPIRIQMVTTREEPRPTKSGTLQSDSDWTGKVYSGLYKIEERKARSPYAVQYIAMQQPMVRRVALTILRTGFPEEFQEALEQRFLEEAGRLAPVRHAHLARIFNSGRANDQTCFAATELLFGLKLSEVMHWGPMPAARALNVFRDVARGLVALHDAGLVHRNLVPDHILIEPNRDGSDSTRITGYGFEFVPETFSSTLTVDRARYAAPELDDDTEASMASDLYAFSAILFRCLTGKPPFDGDSPEDILEAHRTLDLPEVHDPRIPVELLLIAYRGLSKNPESRFGSAQELVDAFDAAERELAPPPPPPPTRSLATPGARPATPITVLAPATMAVPQVITPPRPTVTAMAPQQQFGAKHVVFAGLVGGLAAAAVFGIMYWVFIVQPNAAAPTAAVEMAPPVPAAADTTGATDSTGAIEPTEAAAAPEGSAAPAAANPSNAKAQKTKTSPSTTPATDKSVATVAPGSTTVAAAPATEGAAVGATTTPGAPAVVAPPPANAGKTATQSLRGLWAGKAGTLGLTLDASVNAEGRMTGTASFATTDGVVSGPIKGVVAESSAGGYTLEVSVPTSLGNMQLSGTIGMDGIARGKFLVDGSSQGKFTLQR